MKKLFLLFFILILSTSVFGYIIVPVPPFSAINSATSGTTIINITNNITNNIINNISTNATIENVLSLGFNTTSQLNSIYYSNSALDVLSAYDDVFILTPAHSTSTTAPVGIGGTFTASVGTVSNPVKTYTTFKSSMVWTTLTSGAGLDELKPSGLHWGRGNTSLPVNNGGFNLIMRYNVAPTDATTIGCFGMTSTITAYTNISNCVRGALSPNTIFAGFTAGSTNLKYYSTNATAGALNTLYDCGANFPIGNITTSTNAVYQTQILARPNGQNITFSTIRLDNTSVPACSFTIAGNDGKLPLSTIPLAWRFFAGRNNVAPGTTGVIASMNKIYIASDN